MKITKSAPANFPELRGNPAGLRYPCFTEVKYDGEAIYIHYKNGDIKAVNRYGTTRSEWSKLDEIKVVLEDNKIEWAELYGELHYGEGKRGDLYQLLKNKTSDDLNIKIYDIILPEWNSQTPLLDRKEKLFELFEHTKNLMGRLKMTETLLQSLAYCKAIMAEGYEGVVIKSTDSPFILGPCSWVKVKGKDQTVYRVLTVSQTQERIEIAVPSPAIPHGLSINGQFKGKDVERYVVVGVKVANKHKKNLSIGDRVLIEHQGVLASGSLRHPVFIRSIENGEENV